jgi:UDP-glucuronate 4-epimerase
MNVELSERAGKSGLALVTETCEVSIVLPCLNEAETVGRCVRKALEALQRMAADGEVLVVDNGSTDGSAELARRAGARTFVFGSSSSVYGTNSKLPFSEDDAITRPVSPYAATKRANELMAYAYHHLHGLSVTCLRFFTVYGPRQRPEMAIYHFTEKLARGEAVPRYGDGSSARDYTYIDDIVAGTLAALDAAAPFEIVNLGGSRTTTLQRLIQLIADALGTEARVEELPPQPGDVPITFADVSKAKKLWGWEPRVAIEEGIGRFVEWFRTNRLR